MFISFYISPPFQIVDLFQLHAAAATAYASMQRNAMVTRGFYSEVLFCLSPNRNIKASLDYFSIKDTAAPCDLLLIQLDGTTASFAEALARVEGDEADFAQLSARCDTARQIKVLRWLVGVK